MANPDGLVGGIDSHTDTIHVSLISAVGQDITDHEFATTHSGYRAAVAGLSGHGQVAAVGVEGISSYGCGISTALRAAGIKVVEVNRTRPAERRRQGKSDRLDAYRAARAVLSGEASTPPKHDSVEPVAGAVRGPPLRTQGPAGRMANALLINAPRPACATATATCQRPGC